MDRVKTKGFTLIEILIAILILGIVLSTIYAAYSGTLRVAKSTDDEDIRYSMARTFLIRLMKDFGGVARYRDGYVFVAKPYEYRDKTFQKIFFRSSAHVALSESDFRDGIAQITYGVIEDQRNGGYMLLRRDSLYDETPDSDLSLTSLTKTERFPDTFILCRHIHSLTCKFYDAAGKEYDAWDSTSSLAAQKNRAPSMILVRLNLINPNNAERPLRFMTRIIIPAVKEERDGKPL